MITTNRAHPVRPLIGRFGPRQDALATPVRARQRAGVKPLTEMELSMLVRGRSWGEIDNSPCYPAFAGVEADYRRSTYRSSRVTRFMSSQICGCATGWAGPASRPLPSPGLQHVDDAAGDHVAGLGGVGGHGRRGGMRSQRLGALPFLDHDKGVGSE